MIFLHLFILVVFHLYSISANTPCSASNYGCTECEIDSSSQILCYSCDLGYKLLNGACFYDNSYCSQQSGFACTKNNCNLQDSPNNCVSCIQQFTLLGYSCLFWCNLIQNFVDSIEKCVSPCVDPNCKECSPSHSANCTVCFTGLTLSSNGSCVCPTSYFANFGSCVACQYKCKTCSSTASCTSCFDELLASPPSCMCPTGTYFQNGNCVNECSYNYQLIDGTCYRLCTERYFPIVIDNESIICNQVTEKSEEYCFQHIKNIKNLISLKNFEQSDKDYISIRLTIPETPSACFDYQIFGKENAILNSFSCSQFQGIVSPSNEFSTDFQIKLLDINNSELVQCSDKNCVIYLKIFWEGQLQYIYAIKISKILKVVVNSILTYTGEAQQYNLQCDKCTIPKEQTITSTLQLNCQTGQTCSTDSLTTTTGSKISVTQKLGDFTLLNNTVMPHSVRFTATIQGNNIEVQIKNYSYLNNVKGEITYIFDAIGVETGTITIISFINNANVSRRLLSNSSLQPVLYPLHSFYLEIINSEELQKMNLFLGIGISLIVFVGIYLTYSKIKKLRRSARVGLGFSEQTNQKDQSVPPQEEKIRDEAIQATESYITIAEIKSQNIQPTNFNADVSVLWMNNNKQI